MNNPTPAEGEDRKLRQDLIDCCVDEDNAEIFVESGELDRMMQVIRDHTSTKEREARIDELAIQIVGSYEYTKKDVDTLLNGVSTSKFTRNRMIYLVEGLAHLNAKEKEV